MHTRFRDGRMSAPSLPGRATGLDPASTWLRLPQWVESGHWRAKLLHEARTLIGLAMLNEIPCLLRFTSSYWNMATDDCHMESEFRCMLDDARGLPDGGRGFYADLARELRWIVGTPEYVEWLALAQSDRRLIGKAGGRFIDSETASQLATILRRYTT